MDVNSLNAIAQERARIREAIVKLKGINIGIDLAHEKIPEGAMPMSITFNGGTFVRLLDVLGTIDPQAEVSERKETPTVITSFPGEAVDRHLKLYGHLPELGCCENDQPLSACCNARMVAGGVQCEVCGSNGQ